MASGAATPGITIPRRAPIVAIKATRDAAIATLAKRTILGTAPFIDRSLNRTDLAVYVLIAAHAKPSGVTFVGQDRIAELIGCSQQLVSKSVTRLVKAGYVSKRTKPGSSGHRQNVMRIVLDSSITEADARSIASAPQHSITHHHHRGSDKATAKGSDEESLTTLQRNLITTRIDHSSSLPSGGSENCELIKPLPHQLESADDAIRQWLAYAWKHGKHKPIADEQDLAIAHALVAKHITAEQLETAVIADPEADQLAPLVRSLLA